MKRILSIILSVSLLISAFSIAPKIFVSADNESKSNALKGNYETSDTYLFQSPTTGNLKNWFFIDKNLSATNASLSNGTDGRVTLVNGPVTSMEMLDRNNTVKTELSDFEWQFTYAGIGYVYRNQIDYYMFHVNDNSEYESLAKYDGGSNNGGLKDAENLFVIARSRKDTDDGLKADAFTVLQPSFDKDGKSLGLRPIEYTEESGKIIPSENSYLVIPGAATNNFYNFETIKITLKGKILTLAVEPSKKVAGCDYMEKTFVLSDEALKAAPSGDFVVSSSKSHSASGKNVCHYKNMTIKEVKYISSNGAYEQSLSALLKTPTEIKQWLFIDEANSNPLTKIESNTSYDGRNIFLEGPAASKPLLKSNTESFSTIKTDDVEDFVWSFEYASAGNASYDLISYFMFHVNENSVYPNVKEYDGKGGDGVKAGLDSMSNVFAIAMASDKTDDGLKELAFTVLQPTKVENKVVLRPIKYTEQEGKIIPDESAYLSFADTDLINNRSNWSTINITLEGNVLTLNVQAYSYDSDMNLKKSFTLAEESFDYASSGDFVVTCGSDRNSNKSVNAALFKDMTIYNYSYQQYSEGYTFEKAESSEAGRINLQDGCVSVIGKDSESLDKWVVSRGVTGKKLTDYSLKFDYTVADIGWTTDAVLLRIQDGAMPQRTVGYSFVIQGILHKIDGETQKSTTISLQKNQADRIKSFNYNEDEYSVLQFDKPLKVGNEYTVEIQVEGATIKVWFYEKGSKKPTKSTLSYTDPSATYLSGDIGFASRGEGYTLTNITLKDENCGTIFENYVPKTYNAEKINKEDIRGNKNGTVTMRNGKVTAVTNNLLNDTVYPVNLNNLSTEKLEKFVFEGKFSFNYSGVYNINFGGYKLSFLKNTVNKVVLYKEGKEVAAAATELKTNTDYIVKVAKNNGNISLWLTRAGNKFSNDALINFTDIDWLAAGNVWLSLEEGGFTFYDILLIEGEVIENGISTEGYKNFDTKNLTFEKQSQDGLVNFRGGRVVLSGLDEENKSSWLVTKGVTGKQLKDYTLKYSYIPASNSWTADGIILRSPNLNSTSRDEGYSFVIQGINHKVDGVAQKVTTLSIQKDRGSFITTLNNDKNNQSIIQLDAPLTVGAEYTVEVEVKGAAIKVWFYKATDKKPEKPTISYTDPEAKYTSGDIAFIARDEGFTVSNITLSDSKQGKICENWKPEIYNNHLIFNPKELNLTQYQTGTVNLSNGKYHFISNNTLYPDAFKVSSNGLFVKEDVYLNNFEICFELEFNKEKDNVLNINFAKRDYIEDEYTLSIGVDGTVTLNKCGKKLAETKVVILNNVRYQVLLSNNDGKIIFYIYRLSDAKPKEPNISVKDDSPLSSGVMNIVSDNGDFYLSKIGIKSFDKNSAKGPTGTIFAKDFDGDDYNLDGLEVTINNTEHTTLKRDSDGNGYLRVVGMPYEENQKHLITGVNSRSQIKFGSDELYNFDLTAKIRLKSAFSPNWSYITVGAHANPQALRNKAMWMNVGPRGSTISLVDTDNNLSSNNVVATNGMVKGTEQTSYMPNDSQEKGMPFDGYWHDLKVSVRENTYSIYVDGKFMLSYTDPDNTYEKGSVYLYGYGVNFDLDDILLTNNSDHKDIKKINTTVYENEEGFIFKRNEKSEKILGENLTEFEWEFEYKAGDSNWGRTAFLYRVSDKTIAKNASSDYNQMQNVFGFTITGTNISSKTNKPISTSGIYNNGITVFAPNKDLSSNGNILPVVYTQEKDEKGDVTGPIIPSSTGSSAKKAVMDFSSVINEKTGIITTESINVAKWMTVNVRLVGNKLYLSVWQTGNKAKTFRKQNFVIHMDVINNITEGDFMIVNGDNSANIRNIKIRDISSLSVKGK